MKVKVIRDFIDKHTKVYCPVGMTREVSKERYAEIQAAGDCDRGESLEGATPVTSVTGSQ